MKINCNYISKLKYSDISKVTISLSDSFLKGVDQIGLKITSDYYSSFRNFKTKTYQATAGEYLKGNNMKWSDKSLLCPEMPLPYHLAPEITLKVPKINFQNKQAVALIHAGRAKCIAPIHFDWDHSWVAHGCITGSKRFFIFPPDAGWMLNPIINTSSFCIPRFSERDRKEFTNKLGGTEIVLQAGEGIMFPSTFWHGVLYEEPSLSVSVRCEPSLKGRPFAVLPRSWYLQRLIWKFFREDYDKNAEDFLAQYLKIFFDRRISWINRYRRINKFCREVLADLGEQKGVAELTDENFSSELALASDELRFYYGIKLLDEISVEEDKIKEVAHYIFEAKYSLSGTSKTQLASYALQVRQGLPPKRGIINIEQE